MVFKKLLASLGLGGVEADTVLTPTPASPGGVLTGQVNLRAKSDSDITAITLILVANGALGETELARYTVATNLRLAGGATQAVPFSVPVPPHAPFTVLYGQNLPGIAVGVRTELAVSSAGKAKGDFDPARIEAGAVHQQIMDALGAIGAKFARNELRPGAVTDLPVPVAQAITFYAPAPEGQQPGPHIPQVVFTLAGTGQGLFVAVELAARPGSADRHQLSSTDIERLSNEDGAWIAEVDRWLVNALDKLAQQPTGAPGAFLQQPAPGYGQPVQGRPGYGQQTGKYAYGGHGQHGSYKYSGYHGRPGMGAGGMIAAGVGGAALGFLGGMIIGDMIGDAMAPDATDAAGVDDPGAADAGGQDYQDAGGGYDDFGGGDFGGGEF